jgi:hypothetical protein
MKLSEIFDTKQNERISNFNTIGDKARDNSDTIDGSFGAVRNKKSDPFLVSKNNLKPVRNVEDDPYYLYIKYIVDNKIAQQNPYAPRVYNITLLKDQKYGQKFKIDMEKLEELESLSDEECKHILSVTMDFSEDDNENDSDVTYAMKRAIIAGENIKDEKLKEIAEIIRNIKNSNDNFGYDIRRYNIMIRRTPKGPQIVFTDPLWNKSL